MKKIKIVFVETNCKKNGPIKQTLNIIRYMDRNRFEPVLVTMWPEDHLNSMIDNYRELGVKCICAEMNKVSSILIGRKKISAILGAIKPDIVHGVGMPPYRMTLRYRKTIHFVTLRNYCYEDYPDYYGRIVGTIMAVFDMKYIRKGLKRGLPFVTCSKSLSDLYQKRENLTIPYICNGVDVSAYTKRIQSEISNIRRKLNLPENKIIFVYSGGFIERKNQRELISAFKKIKNEKNMSLLFLGDGTDYDEIKTENNMCKNIIFAGKVSNVADYLHASDIYVSSSKSEGLPNGVLEAMACGLPVLLSDIPQHKELLEEKDMAGYCYKLGDIDDLIMKMEQMYKENLWEMGDNSYKIIMEYFTAQKMSENYQSIYEKILGNKNVVL